MLLAMSGPRGRDPVRAALIEAGADLFSQHGPANVSVRQVAKAAGVNHGLVHRHFGSKDGLLKAVVESLRGDVEARLGESAEDEALVPLLVGLAGSGDPRYYRIVAHAVLDGMEITDLQERFPVVERMLDAARRGEGRLRPEAQVTGLMASGLGLLLFGDYVAQATGQTPEEFEASRTELIRYVVRQLTVVD